MPRNVALIFVPDFSDRLEKTAFHTPVWLADTPANRTAAEDAWRAAVEWPHIHVTLFRPPPGTPARDDWRSLVEQIDRGEKQKVDSLEVVGTPLSLVARAVLIGAGYTKFDETESGFRAKRF
jgi:hypothetical protein